ncbi:MAG: lipocalin family protein [Candidatus Kapaibacterium sp.]
MLVKITLILIMLFCINSCSETQYMETVPYVDLNKFIGKWYEIASYPQSFQKGCHCTTAEYTLSKDDYIIVENRCNKDSINGELSYIKGKAFIEENSGNSKLKVQFFWPFRGKYWIIELAEDYSYVVVSNPNKKYLWILSRTPKMDEQIYQGILDKLKLKQFDLSILKMTPQF